MVGKWKKESGEVFILFWTINDDYPHLGASPNGTIDCDCCGKGLSEIKCPREYSTGLKGWENDKNFAIDSSKKRSSIFCTNARANVSALCKVF